MEATIKIKFGEYEDNFIIHRETPIGALIKDACDLHGLQYEYYGLTLSKNNLIISPTLPSSAFHGSSLILVEQFKNCL